MHIIVADKGFIAFYGWGINFEHAANGMDICCTEGAPSFKIKKLGGL